MISKLTVGPPTRLIVLFTLPLLIGNLFQQAYQFTDAVVVGRLLGVNALAAVGAAGSLQFLLLGFTFGAAGGMAIPIARAFGANDLPAMRRYVAAGVALSAVIAVAITLVGTLGSRAILIWMDTPPELLEGSVTFLTVTFAGASATMAYNFLASTIRALGDSRTPLVFLVVACVLNAGLVWLFIGGFGYGVGGAALATVLAQLVSVVLCMVLIRRRMPQLMLRRADLRLRRAELSESARMGLTMGFQMSVIAVGALVLQYGINGLGADAVAAFTASMRVDQVAVAPLSSFGIAIATYVAQNRGAQEWRRIRVGVFRTSLVSWGVAIVLGLVIVAFGTPIVRLFVGDGEDGVVAMAHQYLIINGLLYVILSTLFLLRYAIQGLGATGVPTLAGFMELVLRALAGLVLIRNFGFLGACLAAPLAWVGALAPVAFAWFADRRKLLRREAGLPDDSDAESGQGAIPALAST